MSKKEGNEMLIKVVALTALWLAFATILYIVIKN